MGRARSSLEKPRPLRISAAREGARSAPISLSRLWMSPTRSPSRSMIVVTHYQRLLNYIVPDFVHVLSEGRIVKSGGKELALELEESGYSGFEDEEEAVGKV